MLAEGTSNAHVFWGRQSWGITCEEHATVGSGSWAHMQLSWYLPTQLAQAACRLDQVQRVFINNAVISEKSGADVPSSSGSKPGFDKFGRDSRREPQLEVGVLHDFTFNGKPKNTRGSETQR